MEHRSFLKQCKRCYNIFSPSSKSKIDKEEYLIMVSIAKEYFENGKIYEFSYYFQEYQYLVDLWAAHLILEYGNPDKSLKNESLEIIKKYSTTPLNEDLANEETEWLLENESKYLNYDRF